MRATAFIFFLSILTVLSFNQGYAENDENESKSQPQIIKNITVEEAHTLIQKNENNGNLVIMDVRTPEEYNEEHIENSSNIDFYSDNFKEELNKLDKSKTYVIHCRSGSRSSNTLDLMKELGFREVYNMGGILQWKEEGLPTIK